MLLRLFLFLSAIALFITPTNGQPAGDADERLIAEVATARSALQEHPKFKKYYEHLAANPNTLPVNGPKLAVLLAAEAKTSAAIKDHAPSLLATWQEVVRLAAAGNDYKTAFPVIDSLQKHSSGLLTPAAARTAKGKLLAATAEANAQRPTAGERETLLELVRPLLKETLSANDAEALPALLAADTKLSWSTAESANSIQLLLPLTQQAVDSNRAAAAKLLFDHLDFLITKTAAGKSRKDFADAIAAARERLKIIESAQQAQQILATKPLDPAANETYGRYLLACGQAKESLTYLALGSDPEWKKLAAESLEVKTAADKVALADRWTTFGKDENAASKEIARHFYQEALADKSVVGVARAAVEEKAKALGPPKPLSASAAIRTISAKHLPLNEWVDVFPEIDFDQDLVRGYWLKRPDHSIHSQDSSYARLRLPIIVANCSYDFVVNFKTSEDAERTYVLLPVGHRSVALIVDGFVKKTSFFHRLGERDGSAHKNAVRRDLLLPNTKNRYEVNVRLKGNTAHLTFSLNGKREFDYEGPIDELNPHPDVRVGTDAQLALYTHAVDTSWLNAQVRVIEGEGTIGRDVPLIKQIPPDLLALKATRLTTLRPIEVKAHNGYFAVSALPKGADAHTPIVGGVECNDFLFAHAPSAVSYAIPPKTKYFTAVAYCALDPEVKFVVKVDGKELFATERRPIDTVVVEIPEGGKTLQLECVPLGKHFYDHSSWCFPAFR